MHNNLNLLEIYDKGINKTWWRSSSLEENNKLRKLMHMPLRNSMVLEGDCDIEAVNRLLHIDFSSLDFNIQGLHNTEKISVLHESIISSRLAESLPDCMNYSDPIIVELFGTINE
jgi:hypothetical protein